MNVHASLKKNAALNVMKQCSTIVFPFITFSYSSHVLGAQQIGKYAFGQSVVSYCAYIASFGITDYAVRETAAVRSDRQKREESADEIFTINLFTTLAAYILLFTALCVWGRLQPCRYVILVQSVQIILTTAGADWVNTAFEDFFFLTLCHAAVQAACAAGMFLFVKTPDDLYIYTFLSMLAAAGGNLPNVFYIRRYVKLVPVRRLRLRKHLPSMCMLFCNSIALVIYLNSDMTIIGILMDDAAAGIYSISTKIYLMAKAVVNAVVMAAVPRLSSLCAAGKMDDFGRMLGKIADVLFLLVIPASCCMFLEAENIIYAVAGSEYLSGMGVLRIYSITILPAVSACFLSYAVLMPLHMERYFLLSTAAAACLNIGLNFLLIPGLGFYGAALTTFAAEMTVVLAERHFVKHKIRIKVNAKDILKDAVNAAACILLCLAVRQAGLSAAWELGLSAALAVSGCCLLSLILKNETFCGLCKRIIKERR